jgi:hypothetical protein
MNKKNLEEILLQLQIKKIETELDVSFVSKFKNNIATNIISIIAIISFLFGVYQFVVTTNITNRHHLETRMYTLLDQLSDYQNFSRGKIRIYINNLSHIGKELPKHEVFIIRSIIDIIFNTGNKSLIDSELVEALYSNYENLDNILENNHYLLRDFHTNLYNSLNFLTRKENRWHDSLYYWENTKQFNFSLYIYDLNINIYYPYTQIGLNLLNGLLFLEKIYIKTGKLPTYSNYYLMKRIISERIANQYYFGALKETKDTLIKNEIMNIGLKDDQESRNYILSKHANKRKPNIQEALIIHNAISDEVGWNTYYKSRLNEYKNKQSRKP